MFRIGTRSSDLAMAQTHWVVDRLRAAHPKMTFRIESGVEAIGDILLDASLKSLADSTGPGLFTKDLEGGLAAGYYDFVVHSLKDLPTTLPSGLCVGAITEREDPRDSVVFHEKHKGKGGFRGLPKGAVVGTSSVRRHALLKKHYPHLHVKLIRGNVNTRLAKLDKGDMYDAIILAMAGLKRLGPEFEARAEVLTPQEFPYGVSQGAIGIECRSDDTQTLNILQAVNDPSSSARCRAERALLRHLGGGCQVPLGVESQCASSGDAISLSCIVLSEDGSRNVHDKVEGVCKFPENAGQLLALKLLKLGAADLLSTAGNAVMKLGTPSSRPLTYGNA